MQTRERERENNLLPFETLSVSANFMSLLFLQETMIVRARPYAQLKIDLRRVKGKGGERESKRL